MYQAKTIRKMYPKTRNLAKLANELERMLKQVKRQVGIMTELEFNLAANDAEIKSLRQKLSPIDQDLLRHVTEKIF